MANLVVDIHKSIFSAIVGDWLKEREVCFLDIAVCNGELRPQFLTQLELCKMTCAEFEDLESNYEEFLDWVVLRKMSCKRLTLSSCLSVFLDSMTWLLSKTNHLEYLEAPCSLEWLSFFRSCNSIGSLRLTGSASWDVLIKLLSQVCNLRELDIASCSITGTPSDEIGQYVSELRKLTCNKSFPAAMVMSYCQETLLEFSGYDVKSSETLTTLIACILLKYIEIDRVLCDDELLAIAEHCQCLESIKCWDANITDTSMRVLVERCPKLFEIYIDCDELTDASAIAIGGNCAFLKRLALYRARLTDEGVKAIVMGCSKLTELQLEDCDFLTRKAAVYITQFCKELEEVNISCTKIDNTACLFFHRFSKIIGFSASDNGSTEQALQFSMGSCTTFKSKPDDSKHHVSLDSAVLGFYGIVELSANCFYSLALNCPGLTYLMVHEQPNLDDSCIELLLHCCPLLTIIKLVDCRSISRKTVLLLASSSHLERVHLKQIFELTDDTISTFVTSNSKLLKLCLPNCSGYTDAAVDCIAKNCPNLMSVSFSGNKFITTAAVIELVNKCSRLICLNVSDCSLMNPSLLFAIAVRKKKMRRADVFGCPLITRADCDLFLATGCELMDPGLLLTIAFRKKRMRRVDISKSPLINRDHCDRFLASLCKGFVDRFIK